LTVLDDKIISVRQLNQVSAKRWQGAHGWRAAGVQAGPGLGRSAGGGEKNANARCDGDVMISFPLTEMRCSAGIARAPFFGVAWDMCSGNLE
jgi:anaerobic glycerol-3-phosphate dehydrogenase